MGGMEANHAGDRGVGQRAHDHTAFPLCLLHHRHWSDGTGVFKHWTKEQRATYAKEAIDGTRARLNLVNPQDQPRPSRAKRTKKKREVGRLPARVIESFTPAKRRCAGPCNRLMSPGRLWKDLCTRCTRRQRVLDDAKGFDANADRRDEGLEVFTIGRGAR